ncbi:MAG: hypothetical protein M1814_001619 [Vezdaea aestivalis]|nr:MAG: hypothetical protein M1814_001619 [Vezdaea aestivalis]
MPLTDQQLLRAYYASQTTRLMGAHHATWVDDWEDRVREPEGWRQHLPGGHDDVPWAEVLQAVLREREGGRVEEAPGELLQVSHWFVAVVPLDDPPPEEQPQTRRRRAPELPSAVVWFEASLNHPGDLKVASSPPLSYHDVVFHCFICLKPISDIGNCEGPKLWLAECEHLFCGSHWGFQDFPLPSQASASCPVCIARHGIHDSRALFKINGLGSGEHDDRIPQSYFSLPPFNPNALHPSQDAINFQYLSLLHYGTQASQTLQELSRENQDIKSTLSSTQQQLLYSQKEISQLREDNLALELIRQEALNYRAKVPEIRLCLQGLDKCKQENSALKQALLDLGRSLPLQEVSLNGQQAGLSPKRNELAPNVQNLQTRNATVASSHPNPCSFADSHHTTSTSRPPLSFQDASNGKKPRLQNSTDGISQSLLDTDPLALLLCQSNTASNIIRQQFANFILQGTSDITKPLQVNKTTPAISLGQSLPLPNTLSQRVGDDLPDNTLSRLQATSSELLQGNFNRQPAQSRKRKASSPLPRPYFPKGLSEIFYDEQRLQPPSHQIHPPYNPRQQNNSMEPADRLAMISNSVQAKGNGGTPKFQRLGQRAGLGSPIAPSNRHDQSRNVANTNQFGVYTPREKVLLKRNKASTSTSSAFATPLRRSAPKPNRSSNLRPFLPPSSRFAWESSLTSSQSINIKARVEQSSSGSKKAVA